MSYSSSSFESGISTDWIRGIQDHNQVLDFNACNSAFSLILISKASKQTDSKADREKAENKACVEKKDSGGHTYISHAYFSYLTLHFEVLAAIDAVEEENMLLVLKITILYGYEVIFVFSVNV